MRRWLVESAMAIRAQRVEAREENLFVALLSEMVDRFDDIADYMTSISCTTGHRPLNRKERNMLFLAFKSLVKPRRASWRKIKDIERVEDEPHCLAIITDYLSRIASEIVSICERIHRFLNSYLIPSEDSAEARVFYRQMKADYFRYLAEIKTDE
ncbi:hypothetical protein AMTR_s00008p00261760 [Amborella trichopoda]|uniref:14-3-3 domain-containing protein n=1 Tax=Amborella trichopoda TaxID=13333 RepID=W1NJ20_AMBTC|nr:hypothetical protein AMTR_s00008p00261760 [Amborella trichopoda]